MGSLVLIGGVAASGKSTLAKGLAEELGATLFDKDQLGVAEKKLSELGLSVHDRDSDTYLTQVRPLEYEALMARARMELQLGGSVVLDAPFLKEFTDPDWVSSLETAFGGWALHFLWVYASPDLLFLRTRRRGASRDSWKLENWEEYIQGLPDPPAEVLSLHNSGSREQLIDEGLRLVRI